MPKKPRARTPGLPKITQLPSGAYHAKVYDYTDASGKQIYRSFTSHDQTQLVLDMAQFKAHKKEARIEEASGHPNLTVGDAIDEYIEIKSAVLSPATINGYKKCRRNYFATLYPIGVYSLTQVAVQAAINREALTHSPKTIRNAYALLTSALKLFRPDFVLHITLPQKVKNEIRIPKETEIKQLLSVTKGTNMYLPILFGACCGLRRSEISALTWDDIDFDAATLTVRRALVFDEHNNLVEKGTKTTAGTRTIRLFPAVLDALKNAREEKNGDATDRICISPSNITNNFGRILSRQRLPSYRFHDLRHYTVSVMLSLNIPKKYIADYVGHETEAMIDQVYGHIMERKKNAVEDLMQEYFSEII